MSERWNEMDDLDLMQLEAEMRGELEELREAATLYADRAWERGAGVAMARPAVKEVRRGWMAWAATAVAAAALAVGGVRIEQRANTPDVRSKAAVPSVQVKPDSPVSDEALLEQIQSDISGGVPAAMEPLQASTDAQSARDAVKQ